MSVNLRRHGLARLRWFGDEREWRLEATDEGRAILGRREVLG